MAKLDLDSPVLSVRIHWQQISMAMEHGANVHASIYSLSRRLDPAWLAKKNTVSLQTEHEIPIQRIEEIEE